MVAAGRTGACGLARRRARPRSSGTVAPPGPTLALCAGASAIPDLKARRPGRPGRSRPLRRKAMPLSPSRQVLPQERRPGAAGRPRPGVDSSRPRRPASCGPHGRTIGRQSWPKAKSAATKSPRNPSSLQSRRRRAARGPPSRPGPTRSASCRLHAVAAAGSQVVTAPGFRVQARIVASSIRLRVFSRVPRLRPSCHACRAACPGGRLGDDKRFSRWCVLNADASFGRRPAYDPDRKSNEQRA